MAFACESLAGTLGTLYAAGQRQKVVPFEAIEIKCGILQLSDALSFLHDTARILHGNVCPDSVYVTDHGLWKLAGFTFSSDAKGTVRASYITHPVCDGSVPLQNDYPCHPWTKKLPAAIQPDLDFQAPEYFIPGQKTVTSAADVFSLGVLICWLYAGRLDGRGEGGRVARGPIYLLSFRRTAYYRREAERRSSCDHLRTGGIGAAAHHFH